MTSPIFGSSNQAIKQLSAYRVAIDREPHLRIKQSSNHAIKRLPRRHRRRAPSSCPHQTPAARAHRRRASHPSAERHT
eukprot:844494-Prymnesium_polylepis.2